jgi:anthranilate/para-aminobenzoate synthase component II
VTARTPDGVIMAVEHETLPIAAVQFHLESIMSFGGGYRQQSDWQCGHWTVRPRRAV